MGVIICDKHGEQYFSEVCLHIHEAIEKEISVPCFNIKVLNLKVCKSCFFEYDFESIADLNVEKLLRLDESEQEWYEKIISKKYNQVDRKGICSKCFADLLL